MSTNFWDFAIMYANLLYNKIPKTSVINGIPDKIIFNNNTDLSKIKVFGCIVFFKRLNENLSKFSPKSKKESF